MARSAAVPVSYNTSPSDPQWPAKLQYQCPPTSTGDPQLPAKQQYQRPSTNTGDHQWPAKQQYQCPPSSPGDPQWAAKQVTEGYKCRLADLMDRRLRQR